MTFLRPSLRVAALLVVPCLLALPACMKAKGEAVLTKDGSGTITEKATFDQEALKQMIEMAALQSGMQDGGGGGQQDAMTKGIEEAMNLEWIKKRYAGKTGVTLQSVARTEDLEKKTLAIETKAKFTSLDAYFRVGAGMLGRAAEVRLAETAPGVWTFTRSLWFQLPGGITVGDEMPPEMASQLDAMKPMFEDMLGGLEIVLRLQVPGTIVETNGKKDDAGTGVTWTFGFADLTDVKKMKQSVAFKGEGLALKPFHLRIGIEGRAEDVVAATITVPKEPAAPQAPEAPKEPAAPAGPK